MTVETDIYDLLKGLVASEQVFPDVVPERTPAPYIKYQQAGGVPMGFLGREVPSKKNGRFQIGSWAETRIEASALALQVEAAFITATAFQASPIGAPIAVYDEINKLYGTLQDFSIWSNR